MDLKRMAGVLLCLTLASGACSGIAGAAETKNVAGKTYYTAANIWQCPGMYSWMGDTWAIYSTNYVCGRFIPVGTPVTIKNVTENPDDTLTYRFNTRDQPLLTPHSIVFEAAGDSYKMILRSSHAAKGHTVWTLFERYFAEEDPLRPDGPFASLTAAEQANVKNGKVAPGMSKKAVLMAIGYPPGHRTPWLDSNKWRYWSKRHRSFTVEFENDVVVGLPGVLVVGPREETVDEKLPVDERLQKLESLKEAGLVTQEEYDKKRVDILKDL